MFITQSELAQYLNINVTTILGYAKKGMPRYKFPVESGTWGHYKGYKYFYLYQECKQWIKNNINKRQKFYQQSKRS